MVVQGFTISGHSGIDFQQSVTTIGSRDTVNTPILTVHNGKVFSTSMQSLSILADSGVPVVDLRGENNVQGGLIKAKGTPTVIHTPEVNLYQSTNGSRVEIHGTNFGQSNSEIIVTFDQTITPGVVTSNPQNQPTETTDSLLVIDFDSDTTVFAGYLRARVERARVPSDNAILGTFAGCPKDTNDNCIMEQIIPTITFDNSELSSAAPQWSITGTNFGDINNDTRVYISIPPGLDDSYTYPGWQRSGQPLTTGYSDNTMTFPIFHSFHPTIYGLTDSHIGPLVIVVTVKGIRSQDTFSANLTGASLDTAFKGECESPTHYTHGYCGTQAATLILKSNIYALLTTTARSTGLNRIEIHGDNFGLEGPSGIFVNLASNFTPAEYSVIPPAPCTVLSPECQDPATNFQVELFTVTDKMVVLDIPEDTRHGSNQLMAMVTRKGGPSIPQVIGLWADEIATPVITVSAKERTASATTLAIHGNGFKNLYYDARVYLNASAGIAGEHLGHVRASNFSSTTFMIESITGMKDVTNSGPLQVITTIQTVKSIQAQVASIIQIPIIALTPQQKVLAIHSDILD